MFNFKKKAAISAALIVACASTGAMAGQVLVSTNGTTQIGINNDGSLIYGGVGLGYNYTGQAGLTGFSDALAPGCDCEAWGASANGIGGQVGQSAGTSGLTFGPAVGTPTSFTTNSTLSGLAGLSISHVYTLSNEIADGALFKATVTLTNTTGSTLSDLRYARAMDWDVPPTEFSEYVTIKGTATTTSLLRSTDDGFNNANPITAVSNGGIVGPIDADGITGPADHGALFVFGFGDLADGASYTFNIYYGAAGNEAGALSLLSAVSPELYSLGQSSLGGSRRDDLPTYIFAFSGVGGSVVVPPVNGAVPEPATWAMMIAGFGIAGFSMRRRRATTISFA